MLAAKRLQSLSLGFALFEAFDTQVGNCSSEYEPILKIFAIYVKNLTIQSITNRQTQRSAKM